MKNDSIYSIPSLTNLLLVLEQYLLDWITTTFTRFLILQHDHHHHHNHKHNHPPAYVFFAQYMFTRFMCNCMSNWEAAVVQWLDCLPWPKGHGLISSLRHLIILSTQPKLGNKNCSWKINVARVIMIVSPADCWFVSKKI